MSPEAPAPAAPEPLTLAVNNAPTRQAEVIELLERLAAEAMEGRIEGLLVVADQGDRLQLHLAGLAGRRDVVLGRLVRLQHQLIADTEIEEEEDP